MQESKFIVNFDDVLISKTDNSTDPGFSEGSSTFEEAKSELVSYWENTFQSARINLRKAKRLTKPTLKISVYK